MPIKIISFGSEIPAEYATCAKAMREAATRFGNPHEIEVIAFKEATRQSATLFKPSFILEKLRADPIPSMWLDADSELAGPVDSLPTEGWDIGFCPQPRRTRIKDARERLGLREKSKNTVAGFAVAFNPTPATFRFLEAWQYLCAAPDMFDGGDHERMSWTRRMVPIRERNIADILAGRVLLGKVKGRYKTPVARRLISMPLDI